MGTPEVRGGRYQSGGDTVPEGSNVEDRSGNESQGLTPEYW